MPPLAVPAAVAALAFAAVLVLGLAVVRMRGSEGKERSLALIAGTHSGTGNAGSPAAEARAAFAAAGLAVLARTGGTAGLQRRLSRAGRPGALDLRDAAAAKAAGALGGAIVGALAGALFGSWWWLALPIGTAAGFLAPDLLLLNAAQRREVAVQHGLPDAIDLLNLCVESGMGFQAALAQVAELQHGPIADEFSRALREMQLGRSRADAMQGIGDRTSDEDLRRFVAAVAQVDRLGVPMAAVLREQARDMRERRRDRARERAQKVPVKIMLPVVFCFFPVLVGIVIAPAAIQVARMFASL